jgi:hypothetical protein
MQKIFRKCLQVLAFSSTNSIAFLSTNSHNGSNKTELFDLREFVLFHLCSFMERINTLYFCKAQSREGRRGFSQRFCISYNPITFNSWGLTKKFKQSE